MKRIFPVISILISLSLLGIIFFQVLWIKGSLAIEEQKFNEHITLATFHVSQDLVQEKGNLMPLLKKNPGGMGMDMMRSEIMRPSIADRYTADEIKLIIRKAFDKQNLKKVPFEFSITSGSLIGEDLSSDNFAALYKDTVNNVSQAIPLESPGAAFPKA